MHVVPRVSPLGPFPGIGGSLAVDFVNTIERHRFIQPFDWLDSHLGLLGFLRAARCWPPYDVDRLSSWARGDALGAAGAAEQARRLRDTLYRLFRSRIDRQDAVVSDLRFLDLLLRRAVRSTLLVEFDGRLVQQHLGRGWDRWMGPVVLDAVRVLTGTDAPRLRMCEATRWNGCGRLFLARGKRRRPGARCSSVDVG